MKKILVLSGKGGTGKTTIVGGFIELLEAKAFADCDVDAPNLHLLMDMKSSGTVSDFIGMEKAVIESNKCIACGKCQEVCRFGAINNIETQNGMKYQVDMYACEGCSLCEYICPHDAISLKESIDGEKILYSDEIRFSTAKLKMGSGNSGKLVSEVKSNLFDNIDLGQDEIVIIDGSPGIGCPVIASISGVDIILLVTEPTISGLSDMKRVVEIANHFKIQVGVCVNKADVNDQMTINIINYCEEEDLPFLGQIPYDKQVVKSTNQGKSVMGVKTKASFAINQVFNETIKLLNNKIV